MKELDLGDFLLRYSENMGEPRVTNNSVSKIVSCNWPNNLGGLLIVNGQVKTFNISKDHNAILQKKDNGVIIEGSHSSQTIRASNGSNIFGVIQIKN